MKYIVYNTLSDDAKNIRIKVFVEEQGFENEFDEIDNSSFHIVSYTEKMNLPPFAEFSKEQRKAPIFLADLPF